MATTRIAEPQGAILDPGAILSRLDRLPPTRTIWRLVALLGLGFFFELYDLLFTGYVAPGLVKAGILTPTTPGPVRRQRRREFRRGAVHRPVHRHAAVRLAGRPVRPPGDLHVVAPVLHGRQRRDGLPDRGVRAQPLAAHRRDRPRPGDGDDRQLPLGTGAEGDPRPRLRAVPGHRLHRRAGGGVPVLSADPDAAAGHRRLALGRADRRLRGDRGLVDARGPAREPALAGRARAARGGGRGPAASRRAGRGRIRTPAAAAGRTGAGAAARRVPRPVGAAVPPSGADDGGLQRVPDGRLLRLRQLGADPAGGAGHHGHVEPRLHGADRARRPGRAADRARHRRPVRAQARDRGRRPASTSPAGCASRRPGTSAPSSPSASA